MSDMHILEADGSGRVRVVMHFPVPSGNNAVNVPWSTALVESTGFNEDGTLATPQTSLRTINAAEKASIEAGAIHEHNGMFRVESGGVSNTELLASLREFYQQTKATETDRLATKLKYFGFTAAGV